MKYFDYKRNRLVFLKQQATAAFWDEHWNDDNLKKTIEKAKNDWFISRFTRKFLTPRKDIRILEGGCGKGQFVYSLHHTGYDAYGIDFAAQTVSRVNNLFPELKISIGDVENLPFSDNSFHGYWSLGVIEHFFEGYEKTLSEMSRVIRPGGYLFLTFPSLSLLRRLKARFRQYPVFPPANFDQTRFYQFALDPEQVYQDFKNKGFTLIHQERLDGLKGLKDELVFLRPILQPLYNTTSPFLKVFRAVLSKALAVFSNHSTLLIFKKND